MSDWNVTQWFVFLIGAVLIGIGAGTVLSWIAIWVEDMWIEHQWRREHRRKGE